MQLGVVLPEREIGSDPGAVRDYARAAEELGYDFLVTADHVLGADRERYPDLLGPYGHGAPIHEPLVLFGFLAAVTTRLRLITNVLILPQRQTVLVAKQAAEIDLLSGGRLTLGVGNGWNHVEYEALGQDFRTRGRRIEEQVRLLRRLWEQPLVAFEGRFDRVRDAGINPRPERPIPIWMGGMAGRVLERIGRLADGWSPRLLSDDLDQALPDMERRRERIAVAARAARRAAAAADQQLRLHAPSRDDQKVHGRR
ncbi:MAG: LLM class F420-dependent oxidoreductase [Chloroflexi bacterium]|nr:LLM class F420-dependent oxidoreductase [Chloroflexota bacterium]